MSTSARAQEQELDQTRTDYHDAVSGPRDVQETIILPSSGWVPLELKELWHYRGLLYFFVWRDIKVRYKQTLLGAAWAIVQPFFTMVVFSIFFGQLAGMPSDGVPYPIFVYTALVPWTYFATALTQASTSLVEHERVITKVYFPRLLVPMAPMLAALVDFAIAFVILVGMMLWYGIVPSAAVLTVPLFVLLATATALSVGLWLAAFNVQYRDVRYVIGFLIQFWLFATPVAYPSSIVPEQWRILYGLNPMVGVVEGFRWALLGQARPPGLLLTVSLLTVIGLLVGGLYYFRRMEESFADVV
ncbi:MAG: ABC transporter permease [Chloroflexota bacterium]|nr:ABC transporter permease [Chloroflexota bacterium]